MKKKDNPASKTGAKAISYGKKKEITEAIENGQISMNQAAKLHGISRSTIQRWFKQIGNFEKKLLHMGGKSAQQEIRDLKKRIQELECKEIIYEAAIDVVEKDFGISRKKLLPESLQHFLKGTKKK